MAYFTDEITMVTTIGLGGHYNKMASEILFFDYSAQSIEMERLSSIGMYGSGA